MYNTKNRIYPTFDKTQKSGVCNFLRALTKQNLFKTVDDILNIFIEDEKYYLEQNSSRFPFLEQYINNDDFIKDTHDYIKACKIYYEYKETQRPLIEANKQYEKQKRKFLQDIKMSKEKPTKKQLYYYEKLCKKYDITMIDLNEATKLQLKNEIERILDEHKTIY